MQNLQNELVQLLEHHDSFVVDGQLNKTKIIEAVLKVDPELIKLLIKNTTFKNHFFTDVEGTLVFDKIAFQRFVNNKSFLPDSYTAFKNKIGLTINDGTTDNYITSRNDVALVWPHKDCVIEGGQTKEDQKRNEIFWNETLAPDNVDRLLSPKAFTNHKFYNKEGEGDVSKNLTGSENLVLKGNNLLCLASLLKSHRGKIRLIYIDPPYNTGNDSFKYNDSFNHAAWLSFMKTRLQLAKELLSADGAIYIHLDYYEVHYCKVLMDEIFGKENLLNEIIWQRSTTVGSSKAIANRFPTVSDTLLLYVKDKGNYVFNKLYTPPSEEYKARFKEADENGFYYWNTLASYSQETFDRLKSENKLRWNEGAKHPQYKTYLHELKGNVIPNVWTDINMLNPMAAERKLTGFTTQKPEKLLQRIIETSTNEGDFVLDFFLGSGSTAATCLKLKRKFIGVEQMDYVNDITVPRLQKVIKGEKGGISENVNWKGGGSFVYAELLQYNQQYIDKIQAAKSKDELLTVWKEMEESAFLSYLFDKKTFNERLDAFKTAPIEEMKQYLVEVLDKNQLYVNYSEMEDSQYGVSKENKELNHQFYKAKK